METLRIAVICASNQNRSMETHALLQKRGFKNLWSFGTNSQVKLPGPAVDKPNVYPFSTTYQDIYSDLKRKDEELYTKKGLLNMLVRNSKIKDRPERFQDTTEMFDIIVTFEDRVYDIVCEELRGKDPTLNKSVHVINLNVKDNPEEAVIGAINVYNFLKKVTDLGDEWEDSIDSLVDEFERDTGKLLLHTVLFY